tara:strand:- start:21969 stop:22181 length:213 start_codon:yes stop_codon:yes gene_type:complete
MGDRDDVRTSGAARALIERIAAASMTDEAVRLLREVHVRLRKGRSDGNEVPEVPEVPAGEAWSVGGTMNP